MTTVSTNFDGGTNGQVITLANSGTSGNALQFISGSPVYSNAQAHSGTLSCRYPASAFTSIGYELAGTSIWIRFYVRLPQNRDESLVRLWDAVDAQGTYMGGIDATASGAMDLNVGFGNTGTVSGAVVLGQWIRVEAMWSTTLGGELRVYHDQDSATPSVTGTLATNLSGTVRTEELIRFSSTTAVTYFDDFAVSTDGWIGPTVTPIAVTDVGQGADAIGLAAAVPAGDAATAADAVAVSATAGPADSAGAADTVTVAASTALADAATAADAITVTVAAGLPDSAAGAELLGANAGLAITDSAAGADTLTPTAAVGLGDAATAAESMVSGQLRPGVDAGSGTDAMAVSVDAVPGDAGSAADLLGVNTALTLMDTAVAADHFAAIEVTPISLADAATASDALSVIRDRDVGPVGRPRRNWSVRGPRRGVAAARPL
ncbi:hypothetical protein DP939_02585 [Spongiactinospora rosea]|uniref:Uncharacterized protein n=1 Tax=Spongiactinospora rosea TaxID=2248750 RepID=A0A366M5Y6_9ACTN|nr:hypothetical protein [Spongiactinospora rosea]RBQ21616.1 hypothetical protein DP939_02585 [Spongiactinospora rosea]